MSVDRNLDDATFSDVDEVGARVFYTLTADPARQADRTTRAVAALMDALVGAGRLTSAELESVLQRVVG